MEKEYKHNKIKALINLLDEPDEEIYAEIRQQMVAFGHEVVPILEEEWGKSENSLRQSRLLHIINNLQLEELYQQLTLWANFGERDMWEGYLLINRYLFKELKREEISKEFDRIRRDVLFELHEQLTPLQKIRVINHILYEVHRFKGNTRPGDFIKSYFVNHLFNKHRGSSISLGILYMSLAQSLGLPVYGILLPRHFILAYMDADFPGGMARKSDVKFYINPVYRGTIFTKREIVRYLRQSEEEVSKGYFYPSSNVEIIKRMIDDVQMGYENRDKLSYVEELDYLKNALNLDDEDDEDEDEDEESEL